MTYQEVLECLMVPVEQFGGCAWEKTEESQEICIKRSMLVIAHCPLELALCHSPSPQTCQNDGQEPSKGLKTCEKYQIYSYLDCFIPNSHNSIPRQRAHRDRILLV